MNKLVNKPSFLGSQGLYKILDRIVLYFSFVQHCYPALLQFAT